MSPPPPPAAAPGGRPAAAMALAEAGARGRLLRWPRVLLFGDSITEVLLARPPLAPQSPCGAPWPARLLVPGPAAQQHPGVGPSGGAERRCRAAGERRAGGHSRERARVPGARGRIPGGPAVRLRQGPSRLVGVYEIWSRFTEILELSMLEARR